MTNEGTFLVNGIERIIINQIVRSPGIYFKSELDKNVIPILICVLPIVFVGLFIVMFFKKYYTFSISAIAITSIFGALLLDYSDRRKINNSSYTKRPQ